MDEEYYTIELRSIIVTKMKLIEENKKRLLSGIEHIIMNDELYDYVIRYIKYLEESLILIHQKKYNTSDYIRLESSLEGIRCCLNEYEPLRKVVKIQVQLMNQGGRG
jgi:hypothetical protein